MTSMGFGAGITIAKGPKAMANDVRKRLKAIVDAPTDQELLEGYWKLLEENGIGIPISFGGQLPIGAGYYLKTNSDSSTDWVLETVDRKERRIPKGYFVKYFTATEILDNAPPADALRSCKILIGMEDKALLIVMQEGITYPLR